MEQPTTNKSRTVTRSAQENMWLIRLAEINHYYPEKTLEAMGFIMSLKIKRDPVGMAAAMMHELREPDETAYIKAMDHINNLYAELFPGVPATTSKEVYASLEGL